MLLPLARQLGPLSRRMGVVDPRFVYDTFTDTSATALESHTGEIGATWTKQTGYTAGAAISNANRVRWASGTGNAIYRASGTPPSAEQDIRVNAYIASNAGYPIIGARMSAAAQTFYMVFRDVPNKKWNIYRIVAGAAELLVGTSPDAGFAVGATVALRLTVSGTGANVTITLYVDGSQVATYGDIHASRIVATGFVGCGMNGGNDSTGWHFSDFEARELV